MNIGASSFNSFSGKVRSPKCNFWWSISLLSKQIPSNSTLFIYWQWNLPMTLSVRPSVWKEVSLPCSYRSTYQLLSFLSICLNINLSVLFIFSIYLLSIYLSLSLYLSSFLFIYVCVYIRMYLYIYFLSVYLYVYLLMYVYMFVCMYLSIISMYLFIVIYISKKL